jgi:hypothetical protein
MSEELNGHFTKVSTWDIKKKQAVKGKTVLSEPLNTAFAKTTRQ